MKKFILLLSLVLCFALVSTEVQGQDIVNAKKLSLIQGGAANDTLTASTTFNYSVFIAEDDLLRYRVTFEEDSVSGTPSFTSLLQGSMNNTSWVNLDTMVVSTGVDSTFYFTNTTGNDWDYLRVNTVGTATAQKSNIKVRWRFRFVKD